MPAFNDDYFKGKIQSDIQHIMGSCDELHTKMDKVNGRVHRNSKDIYGIKTVGAVIMALFVLIFALLKYL